MIKPLTRKELEEAAKELGGPVGRLRALIKVESNGNPMAKLFEPHVFYRFIKDNPSNIVQKAVKQRVAHPKWKGIPYRKSQYSQALVLAPNEAMKATSWGLFQIMGFNHKICGYDNVASFVKAMNESVGKQLNAVVSFIKSNEKMHKAYLNADWSTFARYYNGPLYYKHNYHTRLEKAALEYRAKEFALQEQKETAPAQPVKKTVEKVTTIGVGGGGLLVFANELLSAAKQLKEYSSDLKILASVAASIVAVGVFILIYNSMKKLLAPKIADQGVLS